MTLPRTFIMALLTILVPMARTHAGDKEPIVIKGELKADDPKDAVFKTSPCNVHAHKMKAGETVVLRISSAECNPVLRVEDSAKKRLIEAHYYAGKMIFTPPRDDSYRIIATCEDDPEGKAKRTGSYTLTIAAASPRQREFDRLRRGLTESVYQVLAEQRAAKTDAEQNEALGRWFATTVEAVSKLHDFAKANKGDETAKDAEQGRDEMMALLGRVGLLLGQKDAGGKTLRELAANAKAKNVRGMAGVALGSQLTRQYEKAYQENDKAGATKLADEAEATLKQAKAGLGDVRIGNTTIGTQADEALRQLFHRSLGKVAEDIAKDDIDGKKFTLSDYRGKVVVLYFWSSLCAPCKAMIPHEKKLVARLAKARFALVGIMADKDRAVAKKCLESEGITWRQVWDDGAIATAWQVRGLPTIYVLDADGVIRYRDLRGEALDQAVDELLKELPRRP